MKNSPLRRITTMVSGAVFSSVLTFAGVFSASGAGNLIDSTTIADLIYDPATGNVQLDATEASGGVITVFQLENSASTFIAGNYIGPGGNFGGVFEDVTTNTIADSDLTFTGFSGVHDFGNIFPTGLDQFGLQAYLTTAVYTGSLGSGQEELDLILPSAAFDFTMDIIRNGADFDFAWTSRDFKEYALVSSTSLAIPVAMWEVYDPPGPDGPYEGIAPSGTGANSLTGVPSSTDVQRYFAVVETGQVLFSEGFEDATPPTGFPAGWDTTALDFGTPADRAAPSGGNILLPTAWEVGTPNTVGPPAAATGLQCAGTNMFAVYGSLWEVTLTSPSISMPAGAPAKLTYSQYIHQRQTDFGRVRVLDAGTGLLIGSLEIPTITGGGGAWTSEELVLPTVDVAGKDIKLEFSFTSGNYSCCSPPGVPGFYIDDVMIQLP